MAGDVHTRARLAGDGLRRLARQQRLSRRGAFGDAFLLRQRRTPCRARRRGGHRRGVPARRATMAAPGGRTRRRGGGRSRRSRRRRAGDCRRYQTAPVDPRRAHRLERRRIGTGARRPRDRRSLPDGGAARTPPGRGGCPRPGRRGRRSTLCTQGRCRAAVAGAIPDRQSDHAATQHGRRRRRPERPVLPVVGEHERGPAPSRPTSS